MRTLEGAEDWSGPINERVTQHGCAELGIPVTGILTGAEITRMSDDALLGRLAVVNLFCRVTPQQKRRIIAAFRRLGHVVGFLGDGANDVSALHEADVGISVETATDERIRCRSATWTPCSARARSP